MMIIRGLADFGAEPYRSFFEILSNRMTDFPESSAPAPLIFQNPLLLSHIFFKIFSSCPALFYKSSAAEPKFFRNPQAHDRDISGII